MELDSGVQPSLSEWTHVAASSDGSEVRLYVDGVLTIAASVDPNYSPYEGGTRIGGEACCAGNVFHGLVDDVSILARTLSADEIQRLQNTGEVIPPTEIAVEFSQAVDSATFNGTDVAVRGSAVARTVQISQQSDTRYRLAFSPAFAEEADYTIAIGPNVFGISGYAMDQDRDRLIAEATDDVFEYVLQVDATGPRVIGQSPQGNIGSSIRYIDLTFDEPIDPRSFKTNDVTLVNPAGSTPQIFSVSALSDTQYRVGFDVQFLNGDYTLSVGPDIADLAGNLLDQNGDGEQGELDDVYQNGFRIAREPLVVSNVTPTLVPGALEFVDVTFSAPIDENSFGPNDVRLIGPRGAEIIFSVTRNDDGSYRIRTAHITADGTYMLRIGPDITDPGGILMNQDGDEISGELADRFETTIVVGGAGPQVVDISVDAIVPAPLSSINVGFSEPVLSSSFTPSDVLLTGPKGEVEVTEISRRADETYVIRFAPLTDTGEFSLAIGPNITDLAFVPMDQDGDGISGEAEDVFNATFRVASSSLTADLAVSHIVAPLESVIADPMAVAWTVENIGNARTNAGDPTTPVNTWADRIVFSTNDVLGDADDVIVH